jgi:hypothetical protein
MGDADVIAGVVDIFLEDTPRRIEALKGCGGFMNGGRLCP